MTILLSPDINSIVSASGLSKHTWTESTNTKIKALQDSLKDIAPEIKSTAKINKNLKDAEVHEREMKITIGFKNYLEGDFNNMIVALTNLDSFVSDSQQRLYNMQLGCTVAFFNGQRVGILKTMTRGDLGTFQEHPDLKDCFCIELSK